MFNQPEYLKAEQEIPDIYRNIVEQGQMTLSELIEKLKEVAGRKYPLTPDQCYNNKTKFDESGLIEQLRKQPLQFFKTSPSREYVLNIAAKVPVTCLQELFDNAEKIQEWLKEPDNYINHFDCSAV